MNEEEKIEPGSQDGKPERPEEVHSNIMQEQTIKPVETNQTSEISKSEIENMEVHHHPHVEKKNFKEYFLEFLMIFLAVTLGFFAENIREHLSDNTKEKEYIESLVEDIKIDTTQLSKLITIYSKAEIEIDTLLLYFDDIHKTTDNPFNRNMQPLYGFGHFVYTDRTMQQLKNTGALRLIQSMAVSNSIIQYDAQAHIALAADEFLERMLENDIANKIFDQHKVDEMLRKHIQFSASTNLLLTDNNAVLGEFYNEINGYKYSLLDSQAKLENLNATASQLIAFLKKEYNLKIE
jgi:hypothetical protein